MVLRLIAFTLAHILVTAYGTPGVAETARTKQELLGPVHIVTTKAQGYVETETYDRAGNLVEAVIDLAHGNSSTRYLFRRDHQGQLLEEVAVDPGGNLVYRKRFAYGRDPAGRITASVAVSENGELLHVEFSLYDRFGNVAEQLLIHDTTAHRSLYDVLGRVIYSARYSKGALFSELRYRYDEERRLKELVSYNADGGLTGKVMNEHDAAGRRVRAITQKFLPGETRTWLTTYEYDGWGNWIREVTSEEPSSSRETGSATAPTVQERIIEYYDAPHNNDH